jgi:ABC-type nickel/cobalt efflux system permease component RcnA
MFVRPGRQRRQSRFRSGRMRTERERREHLIAVYAAAAVKVSLAVALLIAAVQAYRVAQIHAAGASPVMRLVLPLAMLAGGLFSLRAGFRGLREAREIRDTPLATDADDE